MKLRLHFLILLLCPSLLITAQNAKVSGRITDNGNSAGLPGVGITIMNAKDTTKRHLTTTDINGNFTYSGLQENTSFLLRTSYIGFTPLTTRFTTNDNSVSIGTLVLVAQSKMLNEVVVQGEKTPVVQKGDTTEMSAGAYKVNVDATAGDLVAKMPGITIENGTVKAHGEDVKRVLVDGKNFFGDDATAALQNLPADVIDKVQVFNKMSDQAEFTGFDDGNSSKVLNVITRADRRKGENGTMTAGTDFLDKYQFNGRLNLLRNTKKITFTGNANNVNNQGFSFQDILGVMGGGGGRGGRGGGGGGGFIGRSSGLNKPMSFGVNYTNEISKKLTISGGYFFNKQDNYTTTISTTQNTALFGDTIDRPIYSNKNSISTSKNYNHRFDMKLEYNIDSANSIIWAPRFNAQNYKSGLSSNSYSHNIMPDTVQFVDNNNDNKSWGYNYSNDLTFRHKFSKAGRTISLGTTISGNLNDGDGSNYSFNRTLDRITVLDINNVPTINYVKHDSITDQRNVSNTKGVTYSGNLAYTEPIGKFSVLQLGYNATFTNNSTNREVYDNITNLLNERYSNVYESQYNRQRAGLTYMVKAGDKITANVGVDYQLASLKADRTFPSNATVKSNFDNWLPNAMVNIKFTQRSNIRAFYRTSTNAPSVTDLQDVITKSNTYNFTQGNPLLTPEYSNNGTINYRYSNPKNFSNFTLGLMGNYSTNVISSAIFYPSKDSTITSGSSSDVVTRTGSLTKPMNFKDAWNAMVFANYGFLLVPIKCNLNFSGRLIYSTSPGSVNNILNTTNTYSIVGGLTIASNISKNADFTLSYMGTYNISDVKYFGDITELQPMLRNMTVSTNTWNHTLSLTSTFTMWERLILKNSVSGTMLTGYGSGYNQSYLIWNPSLGMKVFKNKMGQISVSVFDALKQNQSISQNITALSNSYSRTNILQRFMLFSFTYTIRSYGSSNQERRFDGFGPGAGFGPPGGGRPGGGPGGPGGPMPF